VRNRNSPKDELLKIVNFLLSRGVDPYIGILSFMPTTELLSQILLDIGLAGVNGTVLDLAEQHQLTFLKSTFENAARKSVKLPSLINKRSFFSIAS